MGMMVRYSGAFPSRKGVIWRCDILQESDVDFTVGDLDFPSDEALVLEWTEKSKEEPVCGSVATLKVISPDDRTYADLYTVKPGTIRLDVYRNGVLHWSGTLDPEFYEEPYDSGRGYEVTLTFSDFGLLDRIPYALSGRRTLREILGAALAASGIAYRGIDESLLSTSFADGTALTLSSLDVASENFFDEDGEASSYREVVEGILQPLGLRIVQRAGTVWVYDINGLYSRKGVTEQVEWAGTGQSMGTDRVFNNLKVTFSPYVSDEGLLPAFQYGGEYSEEQVNLTHDVPEDGEYYSYFPDLDPAHYVDTDDISFTLFLSGNASGLAWVNPSLRYFHVQPMLGGSETEGIVQTFYAGAGTYYAPEKRLLAADADVSILRTDRVYLPYLEEADRSGYLLRLTLEMLCDPRYNFFSDPGDHNFGSHYDTIRDNVRVVVVPCRVRLYDAAGNVLYCYTNGVNFPDDNRHYVASLRPTLGEWTAENTAARYGHCLLAYWDPSDLDACGITGWQKNRPFAGLSTPSAVYPSFASLDPGQYIPYPPCGGWIEVEVLGGLDYIGDGGYKDWIRWKMFKAPVLELVRNNTMHQVVGNEDVEYTGILNEDAKEDLDIETICGSVNGTSPVARGLYADASTGRPVSRLARAGRTDSVEQLLIGTLYSQFAGRMTVLRGEVALGDGGLTLYTDAAQPAGTRFLLAGETQDVIMDTSEAVLVEVRPDEYTSED